jgi:hypothetical protein
MLESKDKVINFRVTYDEYESYCRACDAAGLNISEMARTAMRRFVGEKISGAEIKKPHAHENGAAANGTAFVQP